MPEDAEAPLDEPVLRAVALAALRGQEAHHRLAHRQPYRRHGVLHVVTRGSTGWSSHCSRTHECAGSSQISQSRSPGSGHHVQVVQVIAGHRHRRPVPAVRDDHHVPAAHLGQNVGGALRRAVHPLVGQARPGRPVGHLEVVDLLQDRFARPLGVVLVRRERRPVPGRGEHLAGDQPVGLQDVRGAEVADPPRAGPGAAQLDPDLVRLHVPERESLRLGPGAGQREPAAVPGVDFVGGVPGHVGAVGDRREHVGAAGQVRGPGVGVHAARSGQRQHDHLVAAGVPQVRVCLGQVQHPQPAVSPARELGRDAHDLPSVRRAPGREMPVNRLIVDAHARTLTSWVPAGSPRPLPWSAWRTSTPAGW